MTATQRNVPKARLPPATRNVYSGTREAGTRKKVRGGAEGKNHSAGSVESPRGTSPLEGKQLYSAAGHGSRRVSPASSDRPRILPLGKRHTSSSQLLSTCGQPQTPTDFQSGFSSGVQPAPTRHKGGQEADGFGDLTDVGGSGTLNQVFGCSVLHWAVISCLSPHVVLKPQL